jgi:L-fuconate dehydratase
VVIRDGRYQAPLAPGFSAAMRPESIAEYAYPGGPVWRDADSHVLESR